MVEVDVGGAKFNVSILGNGARLNVLEAHSTTNFLINSTSPACKGGVQDALEF